MNALDPLTPERVRYFPGSDELDETLSVHCEDHFHPDEASGRHIVISHHATGADHRTLGAGPHFISVRISLPRTGRAPEDIHFALTDVCCREATALAMVFRRAVTEYRTFLLHSRADPGHWFSVQQSARLRTCALTLSVSSSSKGGLACYLYGGPLQLALGDFSADELLRVAAALRAGWPHPCNPPTAAIASSAILSTSPVPSKEVGP